MFFERSAFSPTASKKTRARTKIFAGSSWRKIYRTLQKCLVAFQAPAKKPCCSPVQSISRTLQKNTRTDHNFSWITSRNIERTLQNTHRCSCTGHPKNWTKQNFYGHAFVTTRQQKTPPQTRICLEPPLAQTTIFPDSLQGISRHPAKYTGAPVQRIQKTNKTELLRTHLCHHQAAKNTTADHDLSRIPARNC